MSENMLKKAIENKIPILVLGAPGTGKTTFVKKLIYDIYRDEEYCIHVNLASIRPEHFEDELFGHVDSRSNKKGLLESAHNKVLFLDEICELDLHLQAKILQVLEEKSYHSIGCLKKKKFTGTIVFSTNKYLENEVLLGKFREDLFHQIKGLTYSLQSVCFNPTKLRQILSANKNLAPGLLNILCNYSWPGNFRELIRFNNYCNILHPEIVTEGLFNEWKLKHDDQYEFLSYQHYHDALAGFEKTYLRKKLNKYNGKINQTSTEIKLSKGTLIAKIKKYDIQSASNDKFKKYKYLRALDV